MTPNPLLAYLRRFGPIASRPAPTEVALAALGAGLGLTVAGFGLWLMAGQGALLDHPMLIAPFGASAVLIFAVPASPLSQPWPAIFGNLLAALCGLAAIRLVAHPLPATVLAVLATIALTSMARALHPPSGALAAFVVLSAAPGTLPAWGFALTPTLSGTVLMVAFGLFWHWATGRPYPLRRPGAPAKGTYGTSDTPPLDRQLPSEQDLEAVLSRLHLEATVGPADLAQLIAAAEVLSASHVQGPLTAADLMSRDLTTVLPDAALPQLATLFRERGFKSLPIRDRSGRFRGLVSQLALVGVSDPDRTAINLCDPSPPTCAPQTPLADLTRLMAEGRTQALVVLSGPELVGMVTRSDLLAGLIRALSRRP